MNGHGQTPRFWFSENPQVVHDWALARAQIMSKSPMELAAAKAQLRSSYAEEDRKPVFGDGSQDYMMQRYKNLALIQVSGSLVKSDSYWNRYYGQVSYDEIRRSVLMALKDNTVDGILAVMSTPGGSAAGADAMATFFAKADQTKPFYSFAETDMCSGGYYLGAPSREIYAQRAAQVGSIGVIMVHMEVVDMYKEIGITPTVFRAGEFKALGSSYEKLDKPARANIQSQLNDYFDMFNEHVVDCRKFASVEEMRAEAGEGRVFMAEKAKEVGLVDQVAELEDCLEDVSAKVSKSSGKRTSIAITQQSRGTAMDRNGKKAARGGEALSEEQIAILAAGGSLEAAPVAPQTAATEVETEEEDPAPTVEANDAPTVEAPAPAVSEQPTEPAVAAEGTAALVDKVLVLGTENAQLSADLKAEKAAGDQLKAQLTASEATITAMAEIVCQAINHRQVALGFQPSDVSAMTPDQQIAQYQKLDADFKTRFKGGPKSVSSQEKPVAPAPSSLNPAQTAARGMTGNL